MEIKQHQTERLFNHESLQLLPIGGRVKCTSVSADLLYQAAQPILAKPTDPKAAFTVSSMFKTLRDHPPVPLRAAFFPKSEGEVKGMLKAGLERPITKMDQGPAGNFTAFTVGTERSLGGTIVREEGVAVVEHYFAKQLADMTDVTKKARLEELISLFQQSYQGGSHERAEYFLQQVHVAAREYGLTSQRRAGVGRDAFFCCRPVVLDNPLQVDGELLSKINDRVRQVMHRVSVLAGRTEFLVAQGVPLEDAIKQAESGVNVPEEYVKRQAFFYCQPDVLIRHDGKFEIEDVNMPDVGVFLTELPHGKTNETFQRVQGVAQRLREELFRRIGKQGIAKKFALLTRPEVLGSSEDTLEHLELDAFRNGLAEQEIETETYGLDAVNKLPIGSTVLLFNVDARTPFFAKLLERVAQREITCYPNPFLRLFQDEATTLQRNKLSGVPLEKFLEIVAPSAMDKPEGILRKHQAIQLALKRGGIPEDIDVIHFVIPQRFDSKRVIPVFRHDIRSFGEVQKAVAEMERQGVPIEEVIAIPIPFHRETAVVHGEDGPRLAAFRFMGVTV